MDLTTASRAVTDEIARSSEKLVELLSDLVAFDTTAREVEQASGDARDEAKLQAYLAARLGSLGAVTDVWEPDTDEVADCRHVPAGLTFEGYRSCLPPSRAAESARTCCSTDPSTWCPASRFGAWSSHPFHAGVRGGRIYGRGVVDMKGGVAAMVFAAEVLARRGVALGGDLLINTVTEEESTGAGTIAAIAHGLGADAAIVTEPTSLDIGIGCRGSMLPTVHIPGRTGHAAATQPPWQEGGAVSAAEKTAPIVDALVRLRQLWHDRPDQQHEFMPPSKIVVTKVQSGNWDVSYAESAEIQCHVSYQPVIDQAWGESFQTEVEDAVRRAAELDPWLRQNPPVVTWSASAVPAAIVSPEEPVVQRLRGTTKALGWPGTLYGTPFWADSASLVRAGMPSVIYGPGAVHLAHTVDESLEIVEPIRSSQTLAVMTMRFCGLDGTTLISADRCVARGGLS